MNNVEPIEQESKNEPVIELNTKKERLQELNIAYLAAQDSVREKQNKVETLRPEFDRTESKISSLAAFRDRLNKSIKDFRKEKENTEAHLEYVKTQLAKNEVAVVDARKTVEKARREAKPFLSLWQAANYELLNSQKALTLAYEKLKSAQQEYSSSGGKLTPEEKRVEKPETILKEQQINPWKSGTFYLFTFLVVVGVIALLLFSFPWYTIGFAVIAALLLLMVIGALQLRNDKNLSDESFLKLMVEVLKQIPFLKKASE